VRRASGCARARLRRVREHGQITDRVHYHRAAHRRHAARASHRMHRQQGGNANATALPPTALLRPVGDCLKCEGRARVGIGGGVLVRCRLLWCCRLLFCRRLLLRGRLLGCGFFFGAASLCSFLWCSLLLGGRLLAAFFGPSAPLLPSALLLRRLLLGLLAGLFFVAFFWSPWSRPPYEGYLIAVCDRIDPSSTKLSKFTLIIVKDPWHIENGALHDGIGDLLLGMKFSFHTTKLAALDRSPRASLLRDNVGEGRFSSRLTRRSTASCRSCRRGAIQGQEGPVAALHHADAWRAALASRRCGRRKDFNPRSCAASARLVKTGASCRPERHRRVADHDRARSSSATRSFSPRRAARWLSLRQVSDGDRSKNEVVEDFKLAVSPTTSTEPRRADQARRAARRADRAVWRSRATDQRAAAR